jgi:hypothetical protein
MPLGEISKSQNSLLESKKKRGDRIKNRIIEKEFEM